MSQGRKLERQKPKEGGKPQDKNTEQLNIKRKLTEERDHYKYAKDIKLLLLNINVGPSGR